MIPPKPGGDKELEGQPGPATSRKPPSMGPSETPRDKTAWTWYGAKLVDTSPRGHG